MTKLIIGIALGLLLGTMLYFTCTLSYSLEPISKDPAIVTIKNESGQFVKKVLLQQGHGTMEVNGIPNKDEIRFMFSNLGENSFHITATLANDSTFTSKEIYIEYGYRGTETITKSGIDTQSNW